MEIGIFILLGLLAVAAEYLSHYFRKKRREELALMARQLGLEFSSDDPFHTLGYPFALLTRDDGRGVENVMWGAEQDIPVRQFDYWYYEESTDSEGRRSRSYRRFSCAVTEVDAVCSHLTISRENLFTAFADRIGLRDIEFESDEFNGRFNVKSQDRKFAHQRPRRCADDAVPAGSRRGVRVRDLRSVAALLQQEASPGRADPAARNAPRVPEPGAEGGLRTVPGGCSRLG
jgi:hypothetical protein